MLAGQGGDDQDEEIQGFGVLLGYKMTNLFCWLHKSTQKGCYHEHEHEVTKMHVF